MSIGKSKVTDRQREAGIPKAFPMDVGEECTHYIRRQSQALCNCKLWYGSKLRSSGALSTAHASLP
jgi:hypothetical protein